VSSGLHASLTLWSRGIYRTAAAKQCHFPVDCFRLQVSGTFYESGNAEALELFNKEHKLVFHSDMEACVPQEKS
jgi:hypothetical protein